MKLSILRLLDVEEGEWLEVLVTEEDGDWTAMVEAENKETEVDKVDKIAGTVDAVTMDMDSICDVEEELDADGLVDSGDGGQINNVNSDERGGGLLEEPEVEHFTCRLMKELFLLLQILNFLFLRD